MSAPRVEKSRVDKIRVDVVPPYTPPTEFRGNGRDETTTTSLQAYEDGTSRPITPMVAELILELVGEYGDANVSKAIEEAVKAGKWTGGVKYLEAILARWQAQGNQRDAKEQPYVDRTPRLGLHPSPGVL